jgi:peptidoglycan-associated lipoprotein
MRHSTRPFVPLTALLLVMCVGLLGCPKRPDVPQAGPGVVGPGAGGPSAAVAPSPRAGEPPVTRPTPPAEVAVQPPAGALGAPGAAVPAASPLKDVFFDFDKAEVREDQKAALSEDVGWLKANARVKITVEGHCDERGTAEYNLGLGERRAKGVKDYLVDGGIAADRIATISYGKERPFVLGHDESAWKWNRRGHFVISGQ